MTSLSDCWVTFGWWSAESLIEPVLLKQIIHFFRKIFGFSKHWFCYLLDIIGPRIVHSEKKNPVFLTPVLKLGIFIDFLQTNAYHRVVGTQMHIRVRQSTVCKVVNELSRVVASFQNDYVKMPDKEESSKIFENGNNINFIFVILWLRNISVKTFIFVTIVTFRNNKNIIFGKCNIKFFFNMINKVWDSNLVIPITVIMKSQHKIWSRIGSKMITLLHNIIKALILNFLNSWCYTYITISACWTLQWSLSGFKSEKMFWENYFPASLRSVHNCRLGSTEWYIWGCHLLRWSLCHHLHWNGLQTGARDCTTSCRRAAEGSWKQKAIF